MGSGMGPGGRICDHDRRWIWSPYGEKDMRVVWKNYFDSREKYERALAIKRRIDPNKVFTASPFHLCYGEQEATVSAPPPRKERESRSSLLQSA